MIVILVVALVLFGGIGVIVYLLKKRSATNAVGPASADVARAVDIVWRQIYGMTTKYPPVIRWVTGKALNCANGTGFKNGFGQCVAGESWFEYGRSDVAWVKGELLSDTALAHELCHHYLHYLGQPDPDHEGPAFAPGGILEKANDALRAEGL